jgi:hypothetical protein
MKPIQQLLTLVERMVVALVNIDGLVVHSIGLGVIKEFSLKGV